MHLAHDMKSWKPLDFKTKGFANIVGPDWRYLNSHLRQSKQFEQQKVELEKAAFFDFARTISEVFHEVGILVHPYAAKDDFPRFTDISPLDELWFFFKDLQLDGIFTEHPYTAKLAVQHMKNSNLMSDQTIHYFV